MKRLIVHRFPDARQKNEKLLKVYVLINEEGIPILLRLWCDKGDNDHEIEGLDKGPVFVVATDLKVATFHGLSLNSRFTSHLLQQPSIEGIKETKEWYAGNKEKVSEWMGSKIFLELGRFFTPPATHKILDLKAAARHCTSKDRMGPRKSTAARECRFPMVVDEDKSILATLNSPDVDYLINMTPEEIYDAHLKEYRYMLKWQRPFVIEKLCFLTKHLRLHIKAGGFQDTSH